MDELKTPRKPSKEDIEFAREFAEMVLAQKHSPSLERAMRTLLELVSVQRDRNDYR